MLKKLKDLIFGLNDFEKTKIEDRLKKSEVILEELKIEKIEDFEIFEDIIYKIKEELRLKSSNLNKTIKNPNRNLKKKDIENFLEKSNKIKYLFLTKAFSLIDNTNLKLNSETQLDIENNEENKLKQSENLSLEKKYLINNQILTINLNNGKIPYLILNFKLEIDFKIINKITTKLFESLNPNGTNIIIENLKVLIIPRIIEDKLFEIPRIKIDIEQVFEKLKSKNNNNSNNNSKNKFVETEKIIEDKTPNTSLKKKEYSLDSLLNKIELKKDKSEFSKHPKPNEDKSKIKIIKDKSKIILEKKEKEIKNDEIKIIKNQDNNNIHKYEIYIDDKIFVYLNPKSKIFGELIIKSISDKKIFKFDESELAYVSIFSKVFSQILFEILNAHGTNLIWDFEDNKIKIIPRFEKDNLNNLKWDTKSNTNEFLEQIQKKLILVMSKEINNEPKNSKSEKNLNKIEISKDIKTNELEEKAKYILDSLKRIP